MAVPVRVRAETPEAPFEESMPSRFWKVTTALAMRLVELAVVAVSIVVEAYGKTLADVAVDVMAPAMASVLVAVIAPPKKEVPLV